MIFPGISRDFSNLPDMFRGYNGALAMPGKELFQAIRDALKDIDTRLVAVEQRAGPLMK